MSEQTIRIAVRKFAVFEDAIRRQFDDFTKREAPGATMTFDALDLNDLHPAIFEHGKLLDGTYDITFMVTDWLGAAVDDGLLADLSRLMKSNPLAGFPEAWSPSLTTMPRIRGGLYGLPYHDGPECLIYRTDLISSPPKTWDEFIATSERVSDWSNGKFGTVVAAFPDGHNTVYDFSLHLWTRSGELIDANGNPSLDTPEATEALAFYRKLVRHPATMPNAKEIHSIPAGDKFMAGEVAMMMNWFGFATAAQTLPNSLVRGKVAIAPIPAGSGSHGRSASLNVYWMLSIASGSRNKELAWRFLRHCASVEMDKLLTLAGAVGCRLSTWNDPDVNAAIPFFKQLPKLHENARSFPLDRRFPDLGHAIERGVLRAIDTDDPVESILRDVQREATTAWEQGMSDRHPWQPELPKHPRPIVIIGCGGIVRDAHLPAYKMAGFEISGVTDANLSAAQTVAKDFGLRAVDSIASLTTLAKDAIYDVAVPASVIPRVLEQIPDGSAVLIQKPLGEDLPQARVIVDLCECKRLIAAVNFQLRYAPYILAARHLIDTGAIGAVHDMEVRVTVYMPWHLWTFLERAPRVEIVYHSVHYIDLIRSFLGEPRRVHALTIKHPDTLKLDSTRTNIALDYGPITRANIETNHGHKYGLAQQESYVKWEGTRGAIKATLGLLMNYPKGEPDALQVCTLDESGSPSPWRDEPFVGSWYPHAFIGSMASLMRFVEGSTRQLPTRVEDAMRTMAVVEACYQDSARGGTEVTV